MQAAVGPAGAGGGAAAGALPDRRAYWVEQMEAAYGFMERLLAYPVVECGEPLCCLRAAARSTGVEVIFPEGPKLGRFERTFLVRRSLVERLLAVAEALLRRGLVLWVEDGYRSPARQAAGARSEYCFRRALEAVRWETAGREPTAEEVYRRLCVWTATTPKFANHTCGSAVDVWLVRRRDGRRVDLGAPYPEFSERTPLDSPFVSAGARRRRRLLAEAFAAEGFLAYPWEFWHFSSGDADYELQAGAGRPGRFGPVEWDAAAGRVVPVADPLAPLVSLEDIRRRLQADRGTGGGG